MDFSGMFKKIGEFTPATWIALAALVAVSVVLIWVSRSKNKWSAATIAFAALAIALSFVLSNIRLYRMPQGGSITPASMLPLMLFAYAFGLAPGLLTGLAYGLLQLLQMPTILTPFQVLLDYPLAFAMLGLAGALSRRGGNAGGDAARIGAGIALSSILRYVCSVLSGVLFFAEYAAGSGKTPFVYSVIYNGSYMLPEAMICLALGILAGPRLIRAMRAGARV